MTDITLRPDPFRSLFAVPSWFDDYDDMTRNRGLKVRETDSDIIAEAVVAGVKADDVEVHIEDGVLTVKAQAKKEEKEEDMQSRSSYYYYYTAALSGGQWDKAQADIENGVVTVTIPKAEAAKPRKIKVKTKSK